MTLGFRDAVEGVTIPLRLTTEGPCATCRGSGARPGHEPAHVRRRATARARSRAARAPASPSPSRAASARAAASSSTTRARPAKGTGRGTTSRTISARLPAGVADGARIRLKGKGSPGEQGGPTATSTSRCTSRPHPVFGRRGHHLTVTVPVTFPEAALGAEIRVPTLGGRPRDAADPRGHHQRADLPRQGQGHRPQGRHDRGPAGHRRGGRPAQGRRRGPQGARGLPRRDATPRRPARRPVVDDGAGR